MLYSQFNGSPRSCRTSREQLRLVLERGTASSPLHLVAAGLWTAPSPRLASLQRSCTSERTDFALSTARRVHQSPTALDRATATSSPRPRLSTSPASATAQGECSLFQISLSTSRKGLARRQAGRTERGRWGAAALRGRAEKQLVVPTSPVRRAERLPRQQARSRRFRLGWKPSLDGSAGRPSRTSPRRRRLGTLPLHSEQPG